MELWIRSQDKTILSKTQNIIIRENQNEKNETNYAIVDIYTMGIYKTKERALEILNEIQEFINNNCEFIENKRHTKMGTYTNKIETHVYEMPEE